jgi:alpha-1,2-mannosyltransferase
MTAVLQVAPGSQRQARRRAIEHALFGVVPALITTWLLLYVMSTRFGAVDFRQDFWTAGWRTLHGTDPYAWTRAQIAAGASFPYPAFAALLFAPFALLPVGAAGVFFTLLCLIAVGLSLRVLSPRDWRLYGVVALWPAVVSGWQTANVTLLLVLGLACMWRYRDRPAVAGALVALLISIKPIVFPLVLWLLATRRYVAAVWALVAGIAVNVLAWSLLGWTELSQWLHLISVQGDLLYRKGYAVVALVADLGFGHGAGTGMEVLFTVVGAGACLWLGRHGEEARSFAAATLTMLVASPQVDLHYFALLLVPLLLMRPRLHWSWLVPLALWLCPASEASTWQALLWWVLVCLLARELLRQTRAATPLKLHLARGS